MESKQTTDMPKAGAPSEGSPAKGGNQVAVEASVRTTTNMKIWKMVSGILSIIFSCFILFQSCAVGLGEALEETGSMDSSLGLLAAIFIMAGGIVSLAAKRSVMGGNIAIAILFGIAALSGFSGSGYYGDLAIWAAWALVCAVLAIVAAVTGRGKVVA